MPAPGTEFATLADWLPTLTGSRDAAGRGACPDPSCAPAAVRPVDPVALSALRSALADRLVPSSPAAPDWDGIAC